MMHVNGAGPDFNAPFGGYKQSGNGREWGELGFEEFLESKAILGAAPDPPVGLGIWATTPGRRGRMGFLPWGRSADLCCVRSPRLGSDDVRH